MAGQNLAVKAAVTPILIGGASLAGRRLGHHVGGWLVGLPLTSGPVVFFLAVDHGTAFAAAVAVGMLGGTISQVAFALAYRWTAWGGWVRATLVGCITFAAATGALAFLHWSALATFALVFAVLAITGGSVLTGGHSTDEAMWVSPVARWDIPVRMLLATAIVVLITELAPLIGAHLAGLLSPFPVFGAVLATFTQRTHGPVGATDVLDGLLLGLFAPAVFFLVLAVTLPTVGLLAFAFATASAAITQAASGVALPSD